MPNSRRAFDLLKAGDVDDLRRLLESDPSVSEATDASGVSLLMHSLYRGHRDLAEAIAGRKESLDIFESAALGRLDQLRACLDETNRHNAINSHSKDGFTALHFACLRPVRSGACIDR